MTVSLA